MIIQCPKCKSTHFKYAGHFKRKDGSDGGQRLQCLDCRKRYTEGTSLNGPGRKKKSTASENNFDAEQTTINETWEEDNKTAHGSILTCIRPKDPQEAAKLFNVDLSIWEADKMKCSASDITMKLREFKNGKAISESPKSVTNWHVNVWFKKKIIEVNPKELAEIFLNHIKTYKAPIITDYSYVPRKEERLLEINNFDLHLGKLAQKDETGENYDMKIARRRFTNSIIDLLGKAKPHKHTHCLFVTGNDFFQADNPQSETSKGTRVDTDTRWQKRYDTGLTLLKDGINLIRKTSPVDVMFIPGNHDWQNIYSVSRWIEAWFRNCKNVNVLVSAQATQFYYWNKILLGYAHGHNEKAIDLFAIMARDKRASKYWNDAIVREWHMGHFHHEMVKDYKGVVVKWRKALTGIDAWHFEHGFIGSMVGSQGTLYSPTTGIEADFHSNVIF